MDDPFVSSSPRDFSLSPRRDANHSRQSEISMVSPHDSSEPKDKFQTPPVDDEKTVANSTSDGSKVFQDEMSETDLGVLKRRLTSSERLLDERSLKKLVIVNDSNLVNSMGDLKSSLQMKDQTFIQSDKGTEAASLDPGLVSHAEIVKSCLELNDCTKAVRVDPEGKSLVSDDAIVKNGLESNGSNKGVVVLDSKEKGLVSDVDIAKTGFASVDSKEFVASSSKDEGLISGVGIAKNGKVVNDGVDDGSNVGRAEDPSDSDSTGIPTAAQVLLNSLNVPVNEGNSGENFYKDMVLSIIEMLPK